MMFSRQVIAVGAAGAAAAESSPKPGTLFLLC